MFWKYVPFPHSAGLCYFLPQNIQGNRSLMRLMVLEQPSAILEDSCLWIAVVISNTFRGNPFDNQAVHANIKPGCQYQYRDWFQPFFKMILPWLLQEHVSVKTCLTHLIIYPCRLDMRPLHATLAVYSSHKMDVNAKKVFLHAVSMPSLNNLPSLSALIFPIPLFCCHT